MPSTRSRTTVEPTVSEDESDVLGGEAADPRTPALNALMQAPPIVSDVAVQPPPRRLPEPTGTRLSWSVTGDWHLVTCEVYARMYGETVRQQARAGDVVQVEDDDRTRADITSGYLVPE